MGVNVPLRSKVTRMQSESGHAKRVLTMTAGALLATAAMTLGQETALLTLDGGIGQGYQVATSGGRRHFGDRVA